MALINLVIHVHGTTDQAVLKEIQNLKQIIMPTLAQLTEKVDALQTSLDAEQEQIKEAIAALQTTIDELRQNQTDGGTAEERQALADKLDAIKADLEGTIADNTEPTPTTD